MKLLILLAAFFTFNSCGWGIEEVQPLFPCSKYLDNPYGVVSHFDSPSRDYSSQVRQLQMMTNAHIGNLRMDIPMIDSKDYYSNKALMYLDTAFYRNSKADIRTIVTTRAKYSSGKYVWNNIDEYTKMLDYYLGRYGLYVHTWEIINEINILKVENKDSLPQMYMSILPLSYNIIKRHNKQDVVLMSGIAGIDKKFVSSIFEHKAHLYFDIFNFHTYSKPEEIEKQLVDIKEVMDLYHVNKSIWLTECGLSTYNIKTNRNDMAYELEQSKRLARIYLIAFAYGVDKVFWYEFCSNPQNTGIEKEFGMVSDNLDPKPAYIAYKQLTKFCPNKSRRPLLLKNGSLYVMEWVKPNKEKVWAVWSVTRILNNVSIEGKAEFYNHLGKKIKKPYYFDDSVVYITKAKKVQILSIN